MAIISIFMGKGTNGFGYSSTAEEVSKGLNLKGKTYLVTGCNSGLGKETARVLALRGAQVFVTARTTEKAKEVLAELGGQGKAFACELSDPKSVRACVSEIKKTGIKLDAIICNAGIMALPKLEKAFGYELQFFTNHIGHFILVTGLLGELTETGRVVMLSSSAHNAAPKVGIDFDNLDGSKGYSSWTAYGRSKFANLLFAKELARRFSGSKKIAVALHPGVIPTNLARHMPGFLHTIFSAMQPLFLKTIPEGAATQVYCATHPDVEKLNGEYFADSNVAKPRKDAEDSALAKKLWEESEKIVANLKD